VWLPNKLQKACKLNKGDEHLKWTLKVRHLSIYVYHFLHLSDQVARDVHQAVWPAAVF
jgi:hypothetical protein